MEPVEGTVRWKLCDPHSRVLVRDEFKATVPAMSSVWFERMDFSKYDILSINLSYEYEVGGEIVSEGTCIFTAPKHYRYADPMLSFTVEGDVITVSANAFAGKVMIDNATGDLRLSDNFFDMQAGSRSVKILSGTPEGVYVKSVYDVR